MEIERINPLSDVGTALFEKVKAEQIERYGRDGGRTLEQLAKPEIVFLVAYLDGEPVGCGAIVPLDNETGELSRIFVDIPARRKGVGTAVMQALEDEARKIYKQLVLETGTEQQESIALYERLGYAPIACWGASADNPRSRCFQKSL